MPTPFDLMTVDVPEGSAGPWRIERFEVTQREADFSRLRAAIGHPREAVRAGIYTALKHSRRGMVMSDTPQEKRDHVGFVQIASGRVLIHGLGLGMCLNAILSKPRVEHVDVVEIDPDVIALVEPHYRRKFGDRFTIIHDDAMRWTPPHGARWEAIWHDVWDTVTSDNLPAMKALHRKFGRRCDWQGSWARAECERETW